MHSAGIRAMGALMDQIMLRADASPNREQTVREALERIAPHCHWTSGRWDEIDLGWNDIQSTSQHITKLTDHILHLERDLARNQP